MTETYSIDDVYSAAKRGFGALYTISRKDIRAKWGKMTREEKYNTMRALVRLSGIAQEPEKFLSRQHTKAAWDARARRYAEAKKLADINSAYLIVANPVNIAESRASNALDFSYNDGRTVGGGHSTDFYRLADALMNYDYCITSDKLRSTADTYARQTMALSERLIDRAAEINANCAKRLMLRVWHNCKEYKGM